MPNTLFMPPIKGLHKGGPVSAQPQYTSPDLQNVRVYDVIENRARMGQRPGLKKWGDGDIIGTGEGPIVVLLSVTYMELQ